MGVVSNTFVFEGLSKYREQLRKLPMDFRNEATRVVEGAARAAMAEAFQKYPVSQGRTRKGRFIPGGQLRKGLKIKYEPSQFGARAVVINTAPHAWIFENGTEVRQTGKGANRGFTVPGGKPSGPGRVFVPTMIQHRRRMNRALIDILVRAGLIVTSDGNLGH